MSVRTATRRDSQDPGNRVVRGLIGAANPLVRALLSGPLHRPFSRALLVLRLRGRRSGRWIETPVGYTPDGDRVMVVTSRSYRWWRNVGEATDVEVRVAGRWWKATASLVTPEHETWAAEVDRFVAARGEKAAMQFGLIPAADTVRVMIPAPLIVPIRLTEPIARPTE